jgi:hypothetical protein
MVFMARDNIFSNLDRSLLLAKMGIVLDLQHSFLTSLPS